MKVNFRVFDTFFDFYLCPKRVKTVKIRANTKILKRPKKLAHIKYIPLELQKYNISHWNSKNTLYPIGTPKIYITYFCREMFIQSAMKTKAKTKRHVKNLVTS